MPKVSVSVDRFVEQKFEKLLNELGYQYSKNPEEDEVSFELTSDEELDLVEISLINECARQIQHLEDLEKEHYRVLPNRSIPNSLDLSEINKHSN